MQQITVFIDFQDQLNMFRTKFVHLQERKTSNYSMWYGVLTTNPPLQQDTITHAVICRLTLLKMAKICPKHVELILEINK
jgi:hypothetical protein